MRSHRSTPEHALIRRTARRITLQTAALFAVCLLALAALAAVFILRAQTADAQRQLRAAVVDADAMTDPPAGILIYQSANGQIRASAELHGRPLDAAAFARVEAGARTVTGEAEAGGRQYQLRTVRRGEATVQAALDLTDQDRERHRLIEGLLIAGGAGIVIAIAIGSVTARRAVRPLEEASLRQQRFVADASHELRTPLTQAHLRAQLLQRSLREVEGHPELAEEAGRLVSSTRELGDIVEELLMSAQLGADPTTMVPVDLAQVARDVVDAEQARVRERGLHLGLRQNGGPYVVPGSPTALRRVVNALVDNAIGHVDTGGHITVAIHRHDGHAPTVVCDVIDDGHGIGPGDTEKIFERFARGAHGKGRRFGIGLALAREVIEAHDGTLTASGREGVGATFRIVLPAAAPAPS
ncbi:MAG TPA: HAMP domain-containing sensor histidine kinase [Micromonosporaceae bacterium]|nr:HAMP domain-containing sensor histidine kinase [Micromonosporaceae bacterium]